MIPQQTIPLPHSRRPAAGRLEEQGFSMLELIIAMVVLTILLGAMMTFIGRMQERYTSEQRMAGVNQGGKTAMDLLTIDINQAGFPPTVNHQTAEAITGGAGAVPVALDPAFGGASGLYTGRLIMIDIGDAQEIVALTAVAGNTISGVFKKPHAAGVPIRTTAYPYPQGIIMSFASARTSTDTSLKLIGDLRGDGTLRYIEYRYWAPGTNTAACGPTAGCLTRSDTDAFSTVESTPVTVVDNLWGNSIFSYQIAMSLCPAACGSVGALNCVPAYVGTGNCASSANAGSYIDPVSGTTISYIYVMNVGVTLQMQTQASVEQNAGAGGQRTLIIRQQNFMPRNVINAFNLSTDGLMTLLPVAPGSVVDQLSM